MALTSPGSSITPYDSLAPVYDHLYTDPVSQAENALVFGRLAPHVNPPWTFLRPFVLDLGCGTGLLLEHHRLSAGSYLGLDCSAAMLYRAQEKFPTHQFRQGFMEEMPTRLPPVDVALALFGSFPYCRDHPALMRQVMEVLRPGGLFIFMAYAPKYLARQAHRIEVQLGLAGTPACHTVEEVQALCGAVGCRRVFIGGLNAYGDELPTALPPSIVLAYLRAEWLTLGHLWPQLGNFLYVEAWKP